MFCPSCGQPSLTPGCEKSFRCGQCGFSYFHNTAAAVLAIIRCQDEILIAIRGREPGKGMLDFPGGFVDHNESLEQALFRELEEELGFKANHARYFGSYPNTYRYSGIEYKTCDMFFAIELEHKPDFIAGDDVASIRWVAISDLEPEHFAFESARQALAQYQDTLFGSGRFAAGALM